MVKRKILVTGANGQVGKEIRELSRQIPQASFVFFGKEDLPLENFSMIRTVLEFERPNVVINCAAYTAVDTAETASGLAFLINGEAVGQLASVCSEISCQFIHISTDYVFDGKAIVPYAVDAPVDPINVYGASKRKGEELAMQKNPESIIIRTSWVYSSFGKNFVKTMLRLMNSQKEIRVVDDQFGSPTYAADLAEALCMIATLPKAQPGVYHYANKGVISWYQFAVAIRELTHSPCIVHPIASSAYPTPAARPGFSVLDTSLIEETFGVPMHPWRTSLSRCLTQC